MIDLSVYLVTDAQIAVDAGHDIVDVVRQAVAGGVTTVQVREKHAPAKKFLETVLAISKDLPEHVSLIVNDRVDVFLAARATGARVSGVHVGQSDLPASAVRAVIGPDAVLGLSASTPEQIAEAHDPRNGVDYIGIGIVRTTSTKTDAPPPLGVEGFGRLAWTSALPAVAIGGITADNLPDLRRVGAAGTAVVSGICGAVDPRAAAQAHADAWGRGV